MGRTVALQLLLLVGCILFNVEAQPLLDCSSYPDEPCGDGWSRIDDERCAKHFRNPNTFSEAEDHCRSLNADLVSVHNDDQMAKLRCLTSRANPQGSEGFWVGAKRVEFKFKSTDGSEFELDKCCHDEPKNYRGREGCIRLKFKVPVLPALCKVVRCHKMKPFVCAKNLSVSSLADQELSWGSTPASCQQDVSKPTSGVWITRHPSVSTPLSHLHPSLWHKWGKKEQRRRGVGRSQISSPHLTSSFVISP